MSALRFVVVGLVVFAVISSVVGQSPCGGQCTVDSDCEGTCQQCMGGICGSGCSFNCTQNTDCLDPNCHYCYKGYCGASPENVCGGSCTQSSDCSQFPTNDCKMCLNGTCSAGCGQKCLSNAECIGPVCQTCENGICASANTTCGGGCVVNNDCSQTSTCNLCIGSKCSAQCLAKCNADTDCLATNCGVCTEGICQSTPHGRTCGQTCVLDGDCDGGASCNYCVSGTCGSPCGTQCVINSDCITKGCGNCNQGTCSP